MSDLPATTRPSTASAADSDRSTKLIVNAAFLLTFFPSLIDFLIPSQTQPLAGIVALPLLLMHPIEANRTTTPFMVAVAVIAAYMVGTMFVFPDNASNIIIFGISDLLPPLFLIAMWDKLHHLDPRIFRWSLGVWFVVGCVQALPFPDGVKDAFVVVLKPFVSNARFIMDYYGNGGRGVILLASEPSISAPTVAYFLLTAIFLWDRRLLGKGAMAWSLAEIGALAVFNGSITVLILMTLTFVGWCLDLAASRSRAMLMAAIAMIPFAVVALMVLVTALPSDIRVVSAAQSLLQMYGGGADLSQLLVAINSQGGERSLALENGYGTLLDNHALGHGIASWNIDWYMNAVQGAVGIDPYDLSIIPQIAGFGEAQTKPAAYVASLAFETGAVGVIPVVWGFISAYSWAKPRRGASVRRFVYLLPMTVWLMAFVLTPLISPWMVICYAMSYGAAKRG
jgi:hypothetical protein